MNDFATARQKIGGLKGVMRKLGDEPAGGRWSDFPQCPFCRKKNCSGVWEKAGAEFFKCHKPGCDSGGVVMTEVGYIACKEGLSETPPAEGGASPAYRRFLELAGCWEEPEPPEILEPAFVDAALRFVVEKQSASLRTLQDHFKIGPAKAIALVDALQRRGVLGPPRVKAPREILLKNLPPGGGVPVDGGRDGSVKPPEQNLAGSLITGSDDPARAAVPASPPVPPPGAINGGAAPSELSQAAGLSDAELLLHCIEVARFEKNASANKLRTMLGVSATQAARMFELMMEKGFLAGAGELKEVGKLPEKLPGTVVVKLEGHIHVEIPKAEVAKVLPPAPPKKDEEAVEEIPVGLKALRYYFEHLPPTEEQMFARLPNDEKIPDPIPDVLVRRLLFKPVSLFEKRGLTSLTCAALAFRGNPRSNLELLHKMRDLFSWEELVASGLWLEGDRKRKLDRRPNTQFCGKGLVGKKPETERRRQVNGQPDNDDKWAWGWCQPVLIPYFDALGQLIKLRPHKGSAKSETIAGSQRIYIPRRMGEAGDTVEKFPEVVICEGEYKAAAIWQTLGAGADPAELDGPALGVCALPGISFASSVEMRGELEDWLREVECKTVYVAFDDEDNTHRPIKQRLDAQIYGRYLAVDLGRKLHLNALVVTLPRQWRNAKGKADWDGALAKIVWEPEQES